MLAYLKQSVDRHKAVRRFESSLLRLAKKRIEMRVSATGTKVWVSNTLNSVVILLAKGSDKALSYQKSVIKEPIGGF